MGVYSMGEGEMQQTPFLRLKSIPSIKSRSPTIITYCLLFLVNYYAYNNDVIFTQEL